MVKIAPFWAHLSSRIGLGGLIPPVKRGWGRCPIKGVQFHCDILIFFFLVCFLLSVFFFFFFIFFKFFLFDGRPRKVHTQRVRWLVHVAMKFAAVNGAKDFFRSLSTTCHSSGNQAISLASFICEGCGLQGCGLQDL